jgi:methylenetetrahydrofolate--tRNA-(uracil-5-)-methyltransferase
MEKVLIVGAGLAGCEAAFYLANQNIQVVLAEKKTISLGPAQKLKDYAELVCTNSLKSMDPYSAHGLLKSEMEALESLVVKIGKKHSVPAGDALAVDREKFSKEITEIVKAHKNIETIEVDVVDPLKLASEHGCQYTVVCSGPLTSPGLESWLASYGDKKDLYFYDAIAPVVDADSLDYDKLYFKDRHKTEKADYLNAPFTKEEYEKFIEALVAAEKVPAHNFEKEKFFESCLPIDLMAERGVETARFSCMKPIGLEREDGTLPYACVQLRKENLAGDAFNLVGLQTRLKYPEQKRVFRMIPGLENAEFLHLGSVHRNTFINAYEMLNDDLSSVKNPNLYFAGQIAGVEGYTESASMGLYVAWQLTRKIQGKEVVTWPYETAIGALVRYIRTQKKPSPSNISFGLLPSVTLQKSQTRGKKRAMIKKEKRKIVALKAMESFKQHWSNTQC